MRWGCFLQRTLTDTVTPLCVSLYVRGYGLYLYLCVVCSVLLLFVRFFIKESNVAFPLLLSPRYRPKYWSMECIEMLRKLLLTSGIGIVLAMGDSNCLGEYEL